MGMSAVQSRLARYVNRLDAAAECVAAGETKRFTGVMCESFHDVWMELHEDLIVIQRIDRVSDMVTRSAGNDRNARLANGLHHACNVAAGYEIRQS